MKHDPQTFLKLLSQSMDDYGIKAFTDLLPQLNYTDVCSGNYDVNYFGFVFGNAVS